MPSQGKWRQREEGQLIGMTAQTGFRVVFSIAFTKNTRYLRSQTQMSASNIPIVLSTRRSQVPAWAAATRHHRLNNRIYFSGFWIPGNSRSSCQPTQFLVRTRPGLYTAAFSMHSHPGERGSGPSESSSYWGTDPVLRVLPS